MTIFWAELLHFYQPPWQNIEILKKIYKECYIPLLSMIQRHENIKISLNVQGCLLDQFSELNLTESGTILRKLIEKKKVELLGSGKYHPILPIIPKIEVKRQVELNSKTLKKNFPNAKIKGFFPPEMAISPKICNLIKNVGFDWIILDGIANSGKWPNNYIQKNKNGMITVFRDTYLSNMISFKNIDAQGFISQLENMFGNIEENDYYVITAQDAETFGHHIKYYETSFLGKVFSLIEDHSNIEVCFISDLLDKFPIKNGLEIKSSSWSTMASDLASNVPYPLWMHPLNPIHKYQYRMLKALHQLMKIVEKNEKINIDNKQFKNYYKTARFFYDESLHSCWLWWGSMRPMWSPNLIYNGLTLIQQTALNAQLALINLKIGAGDEFYQIIMDNTEKLMTEMVYQEAKGQHLKTYGNFD